MKIVEVYTEKVDKQDWDGFEYTGEIIVIDFESNSGITQCGYRVVKGKFTPYGTIRDCGDHYIFARYDRYDRIDKGTFKITKDVNDR